MIAPQNLLHLIGTIPRKKHEEIRICLTRNWGTWKLDIRTWYRPTGCEDMIPTRRGVAIVLDDMKLFATLLDKAWKVIDAELECADRARKSKHQRIRKIRR